MALALENVCRTATMSADEASHWDDLHNGWVVDRVNHSLTYQRSRQAHEHEWKGFFSHWAAPHWSSGSTTTVSPQYLYQYANQAAWLEDNRRLDNGTLAKKISYQRHGVHRSAGRGRATGSGRRDTSHREHKTRNTARLSVRHYGIQKN